MRISFLVPLVSFVQEACIVQAARQPRSSLFQPVSQARLGLGSVSLYLSLSSLCMRYDAGTKGERKKRLLWTISLAFKSIIFPAAVQPDPLAPEQASEREEFNECHSTPDLNSFIGRWDFQLL